jgi:predicted double-glycine peptidase
MQQAAGTRGLLVLACSLLCSTVLADPVRSLLEMRHEGVVIQRWDVSCGAAALATVLTYTLADPVSEREVAQSMLRLTEPLRVKARGGFSLLDLKRYAEGRGYHAAGFRQLDLDGLAELRSPIVPINVRGDPHFVVVRGLNADGVRLADPAFGNWVMSVERFKAAWQDGIGFVVAREAP